MSWKAVFHKVAFYSRRWFPNFHDFLLLNHGNLTNNLWTKLKPNLKSFAWQSIISQTVNSGFLWQELLPLKSDLNWCKGYRQLLFSGCFHKTKEFIYELQVFHFCRLIKTLVIKFMNLFGRFTPSVLFSFSSLTVIGPPREKKNRQIIGETPIKLQLRLLYLLCQL